jgi:hypothetical protein
MSKTIRGKKYTKYFINNNNIYSFAATSPPKPDGIYEEFFVGEPFNLFVELDDTRIVEIGRVTEPRLTYQYTSMHTLTVKSHDVDIPLDWIQMCEQFLIELDELDKFKEDLGTSRPRMKSADELLSDKHEAGIEDINNGKYDDGIKKFQELLEANFSVASAEYNIACCYSLKNMLDEAVDYFKRSIEHGYTNWIHAITDADLINMINDSRTVDIIKELIQNHGGNDVILDSIDSGEITHEKMAVLETYFATHAITNPFKNFTQNNTQLGKIDNMSQHPETKWGPDDVDNTEPPIGTLPVSNSILNILENMKYAMGGEWNNMPGLEVKKINMKPKNDDEDCEEKSDDVNDDIDDDNDMPELEPQKSIENNEFESNYDESVFNLLNNVMPGLSILLKNTSPDSINMSPYQKMKNDKYYLKFQNYKSQYGPKNDEKD